MARLTLLNTNLIVLKGGADTVTMKTEMCDCEERKVSCLKHTGGLDVVVAAGSNCPLLIHVSRVEKMGKALFPEGNSVIDAGIHSEDPTVKCPEVALEKKACCKNCLPSNDKHLRVTVNTDCDTAGEVEGSERKSILVSNPKCPKGGEPLEYHHR